MPRNLSRRGHLIFFEGPDDSGKTSLSKTVAQALEHEGRKSLWLAFPGHLAGSLGKKVYDFHHDPAAGNIPALSLQLLHVSAHIEVIEKWIEPAIQNGTWVVLDRFWWSTYAYGLAAGVDGRSLNQLIQIEQRRLKRLKPSLGILLQRTPSNKRHSAHNLLQSHYASIARREGDKHPVWTVKNSKPLEEMVTMIVSKTLAELSS